MDAFREAMALVPAGVVVIATRHGAGFRGLTATSFMSLSLEPPLVLVGLDRLAQTRDAVEAAGAFSVSVLARHQEFVAERFAGRAPLVDPGWREVPHLVVPGGLPVVAGCVAWVGFYLHALPPAFSPFLLIALFRAPPSPCALPLLHWSPSFFPLL